MISYRHGVWLLVACIALTAAVVSFVGGSEKGENARHHGRRIDTITGKLCISCHDGAIGPHVLYCTHQCDGTQGHTIFKKYPPKGREREFIPLSVAKTKGIVFERGQVTCVSCHNLRNPDRYHLAVDNAKSGLCLSCHIH